MRRQGYHRRLGGAIESVIGGAVIWYWRAWRQGKLRRFLMWKWNRLDDDPAIDAAEAALREADDDPLAQEKPG
uniref:Uncharacterized protein n=1 Tax=viral metagenome TaxID=1070528 RepID=A0A6M3IVB6_9ZZZZ